MANGDSAKMAGAVNSAAGEDLLLDLVDSDAKAELSAEALLDFAAASEDDDSVVLALEDLMPDQSGEIVLLSEDDLAISLISGQTVTGQGIAESHVTAGGVDVTGHHVYHFEGGITLYSPHDVVILSES